MARKSVSSYINIDSPIDRLHPMTKIVAVLCFGVIGFAAPTTLAPYVILIGLVYISYLAKLSNKFMRYVVPFGIPLLIMLLIIHGLFSAKNVTTLYDFGFAKLGLEGTLYAVKQVGSVLVFLGAFYLLTTTTHPGKLVTAFVDSGMNPKIGYLLLATFQIFPQMQLRLSTIREAQVARGLEVEGNLLKRASAFLPLIGPLVMSSLMSVQERGMTLETRGFGSSNKNITSFVEIRDTQAQKNARKWFVIATIVIVIGSIVYRFI
ncbi:MAG: energy-coupling factor transporter transmembrane protein EcfT [Chloroflexi bacterium]|nr:energy-coupling factor transporter transmembrane protein EcfT [Chloroflexota bacterium]